MIRSWRGEVLEGDTRSSGGGKNEARLWTWTSVAQYLEANLSAGFRFLPAASKKKKKKEEGIVPSLPSSRSPRGEGVDPTFLHADLIKPSAERKTGLDSWPCSTLHSIGASERTWWSKQHAAGNWTQLPRCCLFQGFFSPSLPPLFFSSAFSFLSLFLSGNKSEELSPTDMIRELLVRVFNCDTTCTNTGPSVGSL